LVAVVAVAVVAIPDTNPRSKHAYFPLTCDLPLLSVILLMLVRHREIGS
jgi:hypothetical protein